MERSTLLLLLLVTGIIVSLVGFTLAEFLPALVVVALIIIAFLYSDFLESQKSGRKDLKRNAAVGVFVIVTACCMFSNLWILWAGITAMLYTDALTDSIKEWHDARQLLCLKAMETMRSPGSENTLQSLHLSLHLLEQRMNAMEREKSG
jgi:chromate transport protein ChrA